MPRPHDARSHRRRSSSSRSPMAACGRGTSRTTPIRCRRRRSGSSSASSERGFAAGVLRVCAGFLLLVAAAGDLRLASAAHGVARRARAARRRDRSGARASAGTTGGVGRRRDRPLPRVLPALGRRALAADRARESARGTRRRRHASVVDRSRTSAAGRAASCPKPTSIGGSARSHRAGTSRPRRSASAPACCAKRSRARHGPLLAS